MYANQVKIIGIVGKIARKEVHHYLLLEVPVMSTHLNLKHKVHAKHLVVCGVQMKIGAKQLLDPVVVAVQPRHVMQTASATLVNPKPLVQKIVVYLQDMQMVALDRGK